MKKITLIAIFTLALGQYVWAQDSEQRRGIGARSGNNDDETRKSLRGSGNSSGGEEVRKELAGKCLGSQEGRAECGRPSQGGEENSQKRGNGEQGGEKKKRPSGHPDLREIIEKELQLTEEQNSRLSGVRAAWHKAEREIKGEKEISELNEVAKEKLLNAWNKFETARAKILSEEQLAQLKKGGFGEQGGRDLKGRPERRNTREIK